MLANDRPWLLTWELGDWLGHLRGLFALAQARARHGGESVILTPAGTVVPDELCGHRGIRWRESEERAVTSDSAATWSYPEIMHAQGMADRSTLAARIARWQAVLAAEGATHVVANHAPLALIAAQMAGVPVAQIGTGFTCPPALAPMPLFRTWESTPPPASVAAAEHATLDAINACAATPRPHLGAWFQTPTVLWSLPELDPYPDRPLGAIHVGPLASSTGTVARPFQRDWPGRKVVVYARPDVAATMPMLSALLRIHGTALRAYLGGQTLNVAGAKHQLDVVVSEQPLDLAPLLADADLFIGHGGASATASALLAGVPVLLLPEQAEQFATARRVAAAGLGSWAVQGVGTGATPLDCLGLLQKIFASDSRLHENARRFAARHADKSPALGAERAASAIEALLA